MSTKTVSVTRTIPASADQIFDLLADPAGQRRIDGSGTLQSGGDGSRRLALGDTFTMDMKMGIGYTMVNTVIEFEENRRIAWQPRPDNKLIAKFVGGRIWRYELEPVDGGSSTKVTETWDTSQEKAFGMGAMAKSVETSMTKTLEKIEALVAS